MNNIKKIFQKKWLIIVLILISLCILLSVKKSDIIPFQNSAATYYTTTGTSTPKDKGSRILGMGISEGSIGFNSAFALAQDAGVQATELPVSWDDIETSIKQYTPGWLPIADQFYSGAGTKIGLGINPIDTNNIRMPQDLKTKALNDPVVIERYKALVDFMATQIPHLSILYVTVGNEVDIYLGTDDTKWKQYTSFFNTMKPYIKNKFPNAVVGVKVTFDGIVNLNTKVQQLNKNADAVLVTYYPLKSGGYLVKDPTVVKTDFKKITSLYSNKKIYFAEIGYPSGASNDSSELKQATFIKEAFSAWDDYSTKIPFLNFQWLHDQSSDTVNSWLGYYGVQDPAFASFLSTLGLRTYSGNDKQAFVVFKQEAKTRGW